MYYGQIKDFKGNYPFKYPSQNHLRNATLPKIIKRMITLANVQIITLPHYQISILAH